MKPIITVLLLLFATNGYAQFGVSFHQSNLPFVGFNYEIKGKFLPEVRVGIDNYIRDVSLEAVGTYQFINKEDVEVYAGAGIRSRNSDGAIVTPVGLHVFPFTTKKLGFHMEVSPLFLLEKEVVLRGSWGIRYRFLK